jgi:hypothetical protein
LHCFCLPMDKSDEETKLFFVMDQERQGLRFPFVAAAEIAPESSPSASYQSECQGTEPAWVLRGHTCAI